MTARDTDRDNRDKVAVGMLVLGLLATGCGIGAMLGTIFTIIFWWIA